MYAVVHRLEKGSFAVSATRLDWTPAVTKDTRDRSIFIFMRVGTALIRRHIFIKGLPKAGT